MSEAGPVVIGGVGGSGTRVVCELLQSSGVFVGCDLNQALDNLWFTLLFKRPAWLATAGAEGGAGVTAGLDLFVKAMRGTEPWTATDREALRAAVEAMSVTGHDHLGSGRGAWPYGRMERMLDENRARPGDARWGWKEPNSHVVLDHLAQRFPELRFVLVVRHGLDMAYSANHAQLHCWGTRYGVDPEGPEPLPVRLLRYWSAANATAIERGTRLLGRRFTVVRYDDLCASPAREAARLLERLDLPAPGPDLAAIPRVSDSTGRYRDKDLSVFAAADIDAVLRLGFAVA